MSVTYTHQDGTVQTIFNGAVLDDREWNGYDDSDFYVIAWDGEKLVKHEYASTRYGGGGSAKIDATTEIKNVASKWVYSTYRRRFFDDYLDEIRKPAIGDKVTVTRGRKVAKGTTGILFWIGQTMNYSGSKWGARSTKCGVATSDRKDANGRYADVVWTYIDNLDVDIGRKFSVSEVKRRLRGLRSAGWKAFLAMTYPR